MCYYISMKRAEYKVISSFHKETGRIKCEEWYLDDKLCRYGNRPALVEYDEISGVVVREEYWLAGARHRTHGAAVIRRDPNSGEIILEQYYYGGRQADPMPPGPEGP